MLKVGRFDHLRLGDHNVICDICGMKYKFSMTRLQWNNLLACPTCYEERHPQDFVKGVKDDPSIKIARPWIPKFLDE